MSKFILTESQYKKVRQFLGESSDDTYSQKMKIDFDYHGLTYKGGQIDWIDSSELTVTFGMDMGYKSYGIVTASPYNIKGLGDTIEMEITYYDADANEDSDSKEDFVELKAPWENIEIEKTDNIDWIGLDNVIEVTLGNNDQGDIIITKMIVHANYIS